MKFLLCLIFTTNVYSIDILESLQEKVLKFFIENQKTEEFQKEDNIKLPEIPKVNKNALGKQMVTQELIKIYPGGKKFYSMPIQDRQAYDVAFLKEIFQTILSRNPTNQELSKWVNALSGGASRDGVYRGIVLDREFRSREAGNKGVVSEGMRVVSEKYLNTFLEKTFDEKAYNKFGTINLKKNVVQLTLEMIEELQKNPNELMNWYAYFSKHLAQYPEVWGQDFRKVQQLEFHKKWSQSVPIDHIKSEIIIKLFKTLNFMEKKS